MGKPRKGKRHGVRDPLKYREEREQRLLQEKKINNPPKEDQEVSKRFKRFMDLKQSVNKIGKHYKKAIGRKTVHDDFAEFEGIKMRNKNESNKQHLRRVDHLIAKKKLEAEYAKKFNVQIIRDEVTGEIKMRKDPLIKANQKKTKHAKQQNVDQSEPKAQQPEEGNQDLPITNYALSKKAKKKLEKEEPILRDIVKFGEVVKEPPTFNLKQKPNTLRTKKDFLFLSKLNK